MASVCEILKHQDLYKIFNPDMTFGHKKFKIGKNILLQQFDENSDLNNGYYFTNIHHVKHFIKDGTFIYGIELPFDDPYLKVIKCTKNDGNMVYWKCNMFNITEEKYNVFDNQTRETFNLPDFCDNVIDYMYVIFNYGVIDNGLSILDNECTALQKMVNTHNFTLTLFPKEVITKHISVLEYLVKHNSISNDDVKWLVDLVIDKSTDIKIMDIIHQNKYFLNNLDYFAKRAFMKFIHVEHMEILTWFSDVAKYDICELIKCYISKTNFVSKFSYFLFKWWSSRDHKSANSWLDMTMATTFRYQIVNALLCCDTCMFSRCGQIIEEN